MPSSGGGADEKAPRCQGVLDELGGEGGGFGVVVAARRRVKRSLNVCNSRFREPFEVVRDIRPSVCGRLGEGCVFCRLPLLCNDSLVRDEAASSSLLRTDELIAIAVAGERFDALVDPVAVVAAKIVGRR